MAIPRKLNYFLRSLACAAAVMFASLSVSAERLPIKIYTSADGLGTTASFNIVRDARGFIWLCSRDGLVRFDGYRFMTYRIGDQFADPAVYSMLPTRSGDYWINLNRGTDYKFTALDDKRLLEPLAGARDVRVPFQAEPISGVAVPQFEDAAGGLWTANGNGLYMITRGENGYDSELVRLDLPGNPTGMLVTFEYSGARRGDGFWVGTNWGLVRRFADGRMVHTSVNPVGNRDLVRPFAEDDHERLWIAQPDGLIVLKADNSRDSKALLEEARVGEDGSAEMPLDPGRALKFSFEDLLTGFTAEERAADGFRQPAVVAVFVAGDGTVWITTNQGLITFDGKRFRHFTTRNGFATNDLGALTEGGDGSIWIVSYGGLHRVNPTGLRSFDESDGMERDRIHNILEGKNGELLVVSGNFNVSAFDGTRFERARAAIPRSAIFTWQSSVGYMDSRGDWWIQTDKDVYKFSGVRSVKDLRGRAPDAVYNDKNGLIGGQVLKIFEDSGGNLWFSSYLNNDRRGLSRLDAASGEFTAFLKEDGLPGSAIANAFAEDTAGNLWFGFSEGGLARYKDGRFAVVESETGPKAAIIDLFRDSKGRIWIATSREGLLLMEDPTSAVPAFKRFTTAEGLTSNNIRCITEDRFGNIYVGTVRGVNRLSPDTGRILYYGTADGLAADFVNSIHSDKSGNVWIGTFNGLSRLTPSPERTGEPPAILISGVRIAGGDHSVSPVGQSEVYLPGQPSTEGTIQIDFLSTASSFASPMRYQYRFDGQDEWSPPTTQSTVSFANLPAGAYAFAVRALNDQGIASTTPAVVHFQILRPVWLRWWFILLAAAVLGAVAYFVYRYRLVQAVKLERIRTRIASDLHDDIGSSLSQIAILSEVARRKAGDNGAAEPLRLIADTSREMVDSMSDIVWAINPKKDTLGDLVKRMRRFAEETFDAKDIGYRFDFDESSSAVALGADTRRDAYLIFKEAVNNIVKHAAAGNAAISVISSGGLVRFSVADDGVGYAEPNDPDRTFPGFGGNGLLNMRRRAEQRGGTFAFRSEPGSGTTVEFTLPLRIVSPMRARSRNN